MGQRGHSTQTRITGAVRCLRAAACACALALGLAPTVASAANNIDSTTTAVVIEPLTLIKLVDMDFGNLIVPTVNSTITINPTVSPTCTITNGMIHTGACQPAVFMGLGEDGRRINVNRPNAPIVISNGAQTMNIDPVILNGDPNLVYVSGNVNGNGVVKYDINSPSGLFSFRLGGTLTVNAGQATGLYTGTFNVSVQYF